MFFFLRPKKFLPSERDFPQNMSRPAGGFFTSTPKFPYLAPQAENFEGYNQSNKEISYIFARHRRKIFETGKFYEEISLFLSEFSSNFLAT